MLPLCSLPMRMLSERQSTRVNKLDLSELSPHKWSELGHTLLAPQRVRDQDMRNRFYSTCLPDSDII